MLTAGVAIAENQNKNTKPAQGFKNERVIKMRGGKFSRMFVSMTNKTRSLQLNEEQKDQVRKIKREYLTLISRSENNSRNLQTILMRELKGEEFDPDTLRLTAKDIGKYNQQSADAFIDGLVKLRSAIGPENFAKLTPITKIDRNALIELRENKDKGKSEIETQKSVKPQTADNSANTN